MEIERKFLVNTLPNIDNLPFHELEQAYLSFEHEIRIRRVDSSEFYLAHKTDGDLSRGEVESVIDSASFQILSNLIRGRIINKTRFYISLDNGLVAELDIYHEELEGLVTVETEFKSEEDAANFDIPSWYGKEITYDKRYKNRNLARCTEDELLSLLNESNRNLRIRK